MNLIAKLCHRSLEDIIIQIDAHSLSYERFYNGLLTNAPNYSTIDFYRKDYMRIFNELLRGVNDLETFTSVISNLNVCPNFKGIIYRAPHAKPSGCPFDADGCKQCAVHLYRRLQEAKDESY